MNVDPVALAKTAVEHMLARQLVVLTLPAGWERPEAWPLPFEKNHTPNADGSINQPYRPLALLEYAEHLLSKREAEFKRMMSAT